MHREREITMENFIVALLSTVIYGIKLMKYPLMIAGAVAILGTIYFEIEDYLKAMKEGK